MACLRDLRRFVGGRLLIRLILLAAMFVLCVAPTSVWAQTVRTVSVVLVAVHKQPTTSSPVIGQVARGRSLEVIREVGDWVQIVWQPAPDRIGYVRVRLGSSPVASLSEPRPGTIATTSTAADAAPAPAETRVS